MNRYKENGFTLIELLGIIVILGILVTIAVGSYNSYINKTGTTYYESLSDIFRIAVIDYYSDNPRELPFDVGGIKEVTSTVLLDNNYLESFYDTDKKNCEGTGIVKRKATDKYEYKTCIRCPGYKNNEWYGDGCS